MRYLSAVSRLKSQPTRSTLTAWRVEFNWVADHEVADQLQPDGKQKTLIVSKYLVTWSKIWWCYKRVAIHSQLYYPDHFIVPVRNWRLEDIHSRRPKYCAKSWWRLMMASYRIDMIQKNIDGRLASWTEWEITRRGILMIRMQYDYVHVTRVASLISGKILHIHNILKVCTRIRDDLLRQRRSVVFRQKSNWSHCHSLATGSGP